MKTTFEFESARVDASGELCFRVRNPAKARVTLMQMKPGKLYEIELRERRKERSLDANAYMWVLCEKLAKAISTPDAIATKEDVYRDAIRAVGIWKDWPPMDESHAKTLMTAWGKIGTGWISEIVDYASGGEQVIVRTYYGSSQYDTKRMSRLIDNIVQDCKAVGVETLTPLELDRLKEAWSSER